MRYDLDLNKSKWNLKTKISESSLMLDSYDASIKNLIGLKKEYPAIITGEVNSSQLLDLKEANAKYLPVSTQIIAYAIERNNQRELLRSYNEMLIQLEFYDLFLKNSKPLLETGSKNPNLTMQLIEILHSLSKSIITNSENSVISIIEEDLNKIMILQNQGFIATGQASVVGPRYFINSVIGLLCGFIASIMFSLALSLLKIHKSNIVPPPAA
jgi:hypothetical protein